MFDAKTYLKERKNQLSPSAELWFILKTNQILYLIFFLYLLTECDNCTHTLLVNLEKMDDVLAWLKQQLQNNSRGPGSLSRRNNLEANISETKVQFMLVSVPTSCHIFWNFVCNYELNLKTFLKARFV